MYGSTARVAAKLFETLLNDWHGLEVVGNTGLCAGVLDDDVLQLVRIDEQGRIHLPDNMDFPLKPKQAHQLGTALIGAANLSKQWAKERK